jgi:hypothetical protein
MVVAGGVGEPDGAPDCADAGATIKPTDKPAIAETSTKLVVRSARKLYITERPEFEFRMLLVSVL